jgi:hypothetical protein
MGLPGDMLVDILAVVVVLACAGLVFACCRNKRKRVEKMQKKRN